MLLALLLLAGAQDAELRAIAEAVARKDYATAEALSLARVGRDPASALAWFYLGHSRAALERFGEAVDPLQKAVDLGLTDPKVRFQLGHSAHRAGRHDVAVAALRAVSGHDEATYELGVSLFELKRFEEAVEVLAPLTEREGPWRSLARFHRGLALRALGREAAEDLDDPEVRELLGPGARAWGVEALAKAGYDSNVLLLPETSVARGSEEGAAFLQTYLSARWEGPVVVRGSVLDLRYDDLAAADVDAFLGEVAGRAALSSELSGRLSLHADAVRLGHDPLFRRGGAEAALEGAGFEAGLLWKAKDFRPSEFDDLDGSEAEAWARAVGPEWRAAYRLLRDDARENFLDVLTHRVEALVSLFPAPDVELRLEGWASAGSYGAPDPATSRTRRDRRLGGRAEALWSVGGGLRLIAEAELERCDSSASDFDYTRAVGSLGALFSF